MNCNLDFKNHPSLDSKNIIQEYLEDSIKKNINKANALLEYSNLIDLALITSDKDPNNKDPNTRNHIRNHIINLFEEWIVKNGHLLKNKLIERFLQENLGKSVV